MNGGFESSRDSLTAYAARLIYIRNRTNLRPVDGPLLGVKVIWPPTAPPSNSNKPSLHSWPRRMAVSSCCQLMIPLAKRLIG
jgi:hypothetical protein